MTQKADISAMRETPRNMYRKDQLTREIAVLDPATGRAIVTARLYYPGNTAHACIWIGSTARTPYSRGTGRACNARRVRSYRPCCDWQAAVDRT